MSDPVEHLDPNTVPPWLLETARQSHPEALGWLAAGYLAGVQVGRKAGPCMALAPPFDGMAPLTCDLAHGHLGGHQSREGAKWIERASPPPPDPGGTP